MATKSGGKTFFFCEIMQVDSADTPWVKNFVEIALSCSVSEINAFLRFMQQFKMATKSGGKTNFEPGDSADTLWVKNFIEIALSCSVSEINVFLCLTQKFKMAGKSGGKTTFEKTRQKVLQIKILSKSLYLATLPR